MWSILQEELLWHPAPHVGGVPVLGESQAGHDFSSESAEISLLLQAKGEWLPSALYDWEVCGKQECTWVQSAVAAACFFVSKAQALFNLKHTLVVRLLANSFTAFSVQLHWKWKLQWMVCSREHHLSISKKVIRYELMRNVCKLC